VSAQPPGQIGSGGVVWVVVVQVQLVHDRQRGGGAVDSPMAMARLRATTGVGATTTSSWSYKWTICDQSVSSMVAAKAPAEDRLPFLDQGPIPSGAVGLAEQRQGAIGP
jgi:hypothetical protein